MVRVLVLVGAALALQSCSSEPDFDERFEQSESELREKAEAIDAELEKRGKAQGKDASEADESGPPEDPI